MRRRVGPAERTTFSHVPASDAERARIVVVPVLWPGTAGMTLGRWIMIRRGHEHDRGLLAHELVHVRQWHELGARRFLARYLGAYFRNRVHGLGHHAAYEAIPFESEARAIADQVGGLATPP